MPVQQEYLFETEVGTQSLGELFDGRSQLLVHHFMFGPFYDAGCPICSSAADTLEGTVIHLNQHDVTFVRVSRAPLQKLLAYRKRMGWTFPWVSSLKSDFNFDFAMSQPEEASYPVRRQPVLVDARVVGTLDVEDPWTGRVRRARRRVLRAHRRGALVDLYR